MTKQKNKFLKKVVMGEWRPLAKVNGKTTTLPPTTGISGLT